MENDNSCNKDAATNQEEERGISTPLVLSQERLEEVYRRLHCLQKQVKKLQVRGDEQREYDSQMETSGVTKEEGEKSRASTILVEMA